MKIFHIVIEKKNVYDKTQWYKIINKYKTPVNKLHGDGLAAPLISP